MATCHKAQTEVAVEDQFKDKIEFRQTAKVKTGDSDSDSIDVWLDDDGSLILEDGMITVEKDYIPAFIHAVKIVTGVK